MCEILLAVWPEPSPASVVVDWALKLERYGLGGFGWGMAWRDGGRVREHRCAKSLAEDGEGRAELSGVRSTHYLVHLRRPSQLSTIQMADTQPFLDRWGTFAFAHNGRLDAADGMREHFAGRLLGKADSEVGFCLFQDRVGQGMAPSDALAAVHLELGGTANLAYLGSTGSPLIYHGAPTNQMWGFRLAGADVASTALHSGDQALFDLCFPKASDRRAVGIGEVIRVGGETGEQDPDLVGLEGNHRSQPVPWRATDSRH